MDKKKLAAKIIKDVKKKIENWNERSQFKLKGVGNLSMSDMHTITMYCDDYIKLGSWNLLIGPYGGVKEVFEAYGWYEDNADE